MLYINKKITILGSTGSIGVQALNVARHAGLKVTALAAGSNIRLLEEQIREFRPAAAAVYDEKAAAILKIAAADCETKIYSGMSGLCACAELETDLVLVSVVGMIGLRPTMAAIEAGHNIALANKETLVAGGELVMNSARRRNVRILPVDSEHSAIFQCLEGAPPNNAVSRIILTASGGPFFEYDKAEMANIKAADALKHPTWKMGAKITVDCATMMNKGLEIIEAVHLFGLPPDKIDVVVHRESIIHSLVEFNDNSVLAQMGLPDMHLPIQYAVTYPERHPSPAKRLNLAEIGKLTFFEPDCEKFPLLRLCREAIIAGGLRPAAANGANEEAVKLFLEDKISYFRLCEIVEKAAAGQSPSSGFTLEDIFEADREARLRVK